MKRIALFAAASLVLAACSGESKEAKPDSAAGAMAPAPAMDTTKKDTTAMTPPAAPMADTTKK
jgi:ABC-type glycerol-3-phosphate transport system substrate-binding protein